MKLVKKISNLTWIDMSVRSARSALGEQSGSAEVPKEKIHYIDLPLPSNLKLYSYKMSVLGRRKQCYRMF